MFMIWMPGSEMEEESEEQYTVWHGPHGLFGSAMADSILATGFGVQAYALNA